MVVIETRTPKLRFMQQDGVVSFNDSNGGYISHLNEARSLHENQDRNKRRNTTCKGWPICSQNIYTVVYL